MVGHVDLKGGGIKSEMAYQVARKHSVALRAIAVVTLGVMPLAILMITDIDDDQDNHPEGYGSPDDPFDWFPALFQLNDFNPDGLSIAALIGPETAENGCNAGASPRLHEFGALFVDDNTAVANICDDFVHQGTLLRRNSCSICFQQL